MARTGKVLLSKQSLRYALGIVWLLDGALQLQSFMFTSGFAHQVIAPAATGQPGFVSGPVLWNARLISGHPTLFDAFFAAIQLMLGLGFFVKRFVRPVIIGSVAWAFGVWYLGEGLGGVAGAHATALVGAPGAALLYAVLAIAAWPERSFVPGNPNAVDGRWPPLWTVWAWGGLWIVSAFMSLLPGNIRPSDLSSQLASNASSVPSWLAGVDRASASLARSAGLTAVACIVGIELTIGLFAFSHSRMRLPAMYAGMLLAALYWAIGQSFGELFSGQATDPATGPLVILLGLAAVGAMRREREPQLVAGQVPVTEVLVASAGHLRRVSTSEPEGVTRTVCSN